MPRNQRPELIIMNDADTNHLARAGTMPSTVHNAVTTLVDATGRCLSALALRYRIVRDERALLQMDDRMLSDIGVSRGEIAEAVRSGRSRD